MLGTSLVLSVLRTATSIRSSGYVKFLGSNNDWLFKPTFVPIIKRQNVLITFFIQKGLNLWNFTG